MVGIGMDPDVVTRFQENGFVVLRSAFDPAPLSREVDRAFAEGFRPGHEGHVISQGSGRVSFRYLPMMCDRTPVSLDLLDRFASVATELLGRQVIPGRAKGTRYYGDTGWHRDSDRALPSLGFLAYLEPLKSRTGALRVLPGSHLDPGVAVPPSYGGDIRVPGHPVETEPGDVIAFDEHLVHGSHGGGERRQWRVDFVLDPQSAEERARVLEYFARIFPNDQRHAPYDARRYPSYGQYWQTFERPWTAGFEISACTTERGWQKALRALTARSAGGGESSMCRAPPPGGGSARVGYHVCQNDAVDGTHEKLAIFFGRERLSWLAARVLFCSMFRAVRW